jgi:hypothetical protein
LVCFPFFCFLFQEHDGRKIYQLAALEHFRDFHFAIVVVFSLDAVLHGESQHSLADVEPFPPLALVLERVRSNDNSRSMSLPKTKKKKKARKKERKSTKTSHRRCGGLTRLFFHWPV